MHKIFSLAHLKQLWNSPVGFHEHSIVAKRKIFLWMAMAFQAGSINVGGFIACGAFVSHVTGFGSQIGLSLAKQGWKFSALLFLSVPVSFIFGAFLSGVFIEGRRLKNNRPHYFLPMGCIVLVLGTVLFLNYCGYWDVFNNGIMVMRDYLLIALLCFACGMQNALVTLASGGSFRSTHLTGVATDVGIGFLRLNHLAHNIEAYRYEKRILFIRLGSIAAFSLGSMVAGVFFYKHGYLGFVLPFTMSIVFFIFTVREEFFGKKKITR